MRRAYEGGFELIAKQFLRQLHPAPSRSCNLQVAACTSGAKRAPKLVALASTLPAEIHAEVLVKPLVVRLKELFQPLPGNRVHFLVMTFVAVREGLL